MNPGISLEKTDTTGKIGQENLQNWKIWAERKRKVCRSGRFGQGEKGKSAEVEDFGREKKESLQNWKIYAEGKRKKEK